MNKAIQSFLEKMTLIKETISSISKAGGKAYLVGGAVRDFILGIPIEDADIEIHKLKIDDLEKILRSLGPVSLVGKQFGVFKVHGIDIDWSLPRRDSKGRKPSVTIEPEMSIEDACRRRDLTMNSMAIDLSTITNKLDLIETKTNEGTNLDLHQIIDVIDPFDGLKDIKSQTLRATDITLFNDDPLRFYRVMQFIGRFEMQPDEQLNNLCIATKLGKDQVSQERVTTELEKLLLKAARPSLGFRWVEKIGRLKELFPELGDTVDTPQRPDFHPEGNVFEHTMQVLDAASQTHIEASSKEILHIKTKSEKLLLLLTALCHDLGKVPCTDSQLHAYGHATAGTKLTLKFLKRFSFNKKLVSGVRTMVEFSHPRFSKRTSPFKYKKLAMKLAPYANFRLLMLLKIADAQGRNPQKGSPLSNKSVEYYEFARQANQIGILEKPEEPVLKGKHLKAIVRSGPEMGELLKTAYQIQIQNNIRDPQKLKELVMRTSTKNK